jgi:hypothetical protein
VVQTEATTTIEVQTKPIPFVEGKTQAHACGRWGLHKQKQALRLVVERPTDSEAKIIKSMSEVPAVV